MRREEVSTNQRKTLDLQGNVWGFFLKKEQDKVVFNAKIAPATGFDWF